MTILPPTSLRPGIVQVFEDMVRFRRSLIASCAAVPFALLVLGGFAAAAEPAGEIVRGTVLETMNASNYTYVRIDGGSVEVWAAGPHTDVKVGDTVSFRRGTEMRAFRSNALDRTFQSIQFVDRISVGRARRPPRSSRRRRTALRERMRRLLRSTVPRTKA